MQRQIVKEFDFDSLADSYDRWYESAVGQMYDKLEKRVFDILLKDEPTSGQLLEVGCGTGHWSKYFSEKGYEIIGIDTSEQMVNAARRKNIPDCFFQVADGQDIPFDDNSFDGAASITTLEFAEDPQKVISEMARSVKPGGKLFFGVLNSLSPYNRKRQKIKNSLYEQAELFSPEQLSNLLAGFGKVRTEVAGFVPQNQSLIWMAPVLEILYRSVNSKKGAFIAAEVRL